MPDHSPFSPKLPSPHANRHAWALEKYGHLMSEALRKDTSAEAREVEKLSEAQISAHIVSLILEKADPTQNKGMTAWLVGQYAEGKLRLEDLGTANETLTMFQRYAQRLEKRQRDLGQYPSLAAVWEAVIGFASDEEKRLSGKAQKALDRDKAYAESRILRQDPDGFTVAVPLTEFAAKWWGKGTRWCTSAEKGNQFWQYHQKAPLIVVVIPELKEKGKFQIWASAGSVQFMDASDQRASEDLIASYWPRFEPVISVALRQVGEALRYVPWDVRTREMCRIAVARNGWALKYVPEALRTDEMCRFAVAQHGGALDYVPQKLRSDQMCRIAVAQNGEALYYVPEALRTDDMCRFAVAQHGGALDYVPQKLRTAEMCRIAVAQNGTALEYVPEALRTEDMCRTAVAQNGRALVAVPDVLLTGRRIWKFCSMRHRIRAQKKYADEIRRIAVMQNGKTLEYIPKDLRTEELCRLAVAQNGGALKHVPAALRTEDMCRIAVARNGWALWAVPEKLRTEDLCRIAVAQNGRALYHLPKELRTEALCRIAVLQCWKAWMHVPDDLRSPMRDLLSAPIPTWDSSLLDEMDSVIGHPKTPDVLRALNA
jgi:exosome complex RNA-binding protein Rrp4